MPLFKTKRDAFNWIKNGQKTIDIRKGNVNEDNYKAIIPIAKSLDEVIEYMKVIYKNLDGTFTAYYLKIEG